jgi:molybdenum cofactor guanylyltransferase
MKIFAVVLAGGQGSRLGHVRKGDLLFGGHTLRQRVMARLAVDEVLPELPDLPGLAGPLAGVAAAARHLKGFASAEDVLVSVAIDTPFLPHDYVPRLVAALGDARAAHSAWLGQIYPTNAAYRFGAIADLLQRAEALGSPKRLLEALRAATVDWAEAAEDPFANLNTLGDLVRLARRGS